MTPRAVFALTAALEMLVGVAALVAPGVLLALFALETSETSTFLARLGGASVIGFAVVNWSARDSADTPLGRAVMWSATLVNVIGAVVALAAQLAGLMNVFGWAVVGVHAAFGATRAYSIKAGAPR